MNITCPVVTIKNIKKHPNADSLEIISFNEINYTCIDRLGVRKIGDKVVYIPIGAYVPINKREFTFLEKYIANDVKFMEIKQINIRDQISQGLIIDLPKNKSHIEIGTDMKNFFGVIDKHGN